MEGVEKNSLTLGDNQCPVTGVGRTCDTSGSWAASVLHLNFRTSTELIFFYFEAALLAAYLGFYWCSVVAYVASLCQWSTEAAG